MNLSLQSNQELLAEESDLKLKMEQFAEKRKKTPRRIYKAKYDYLDSRLKAIQVTIERQESLIVTN